MLSVQIEVRYAKTANVSYAKLGILKILNLLQIKGGSVYVSTVKWGQAPAALQQLSPQLIMLLLSRGSTLAQAIACNDDGPGTLGDYTHLVWITGCSVLSRCLLIFLTFPGPSSGPPALHSVSRPTSACSAKWR